MYLFHSKKKANNFIKKCEEVITWINNNRESKSAREYNAGGFLNQATRICEENKISVSDTAARKKVYDELVFQDEKNWELLVQKKIPKRLLTTYQLMAKFWELREPNNTCFSVEEMEVID